METDGGYIRVAEYREWISGATKKKRDRRASLAAVHPGFFTFALLTRDALLSLFCSKSGLFRHADFLFTRILLFGVDENFNAVSWKMGGGCGVN